MSEPRERSRVRVLVLTAPLADGHLAAARVLAEEIPRRNEHADVIVRDALPALPLPVRWLLKDAYHWQLRNAPWLFALVFAGLRRSRVLRSLSRATLSLVCSRAIARVVRANPSDVIVSTWPATTQILGCLRLRGKICIPVCATITDFAGVELWADKGVDVHLVMHESLVAGVERVAGRGSAKTVSPLVSSAFFEPRRSTDARRVLGLPAEGTVIVVSGGGWAVGDLRGAIEAALEIDDSVVVCLAGRDAERHAQLAGAFAHEPRVIVLGFTDRMSDLLASADGLVHSTGGVTCLEALVRGCPIVAYGAPSGHGPLLAKRMSALGLLRYARSSVELRAALSSLGRPAALLPRGVDAASLVLGVVPRVAARRRSRLARPMASALGGVVLLFGIMASDITYPVVAEALALPESTSIAS